MDPANDLPKLSTCTTCRFKEDFSNYWTAVMFFKHRNGSYIRVPQMANQVTGNPSGGMTVYYFQPFNGETVTAFKKGFRMIVGDPMIRNNTFINPDSGEAKALSFRCFDANFSGPSAPYAPGNGFDTVDFPKQKCAGGIRANIYFPSCWDGVNLDSPNHHSHMAYPLGPPDQSDLYYFGGTCPASHPVRVPVIFMETMWDTRRFNDLEWPEDGSQPLVFSMGDPTGYGQHADYIFGWEGDSLQRAMDKCVGGSGVPEACKELTLNTDEEMNKCTQTPRVDEITEGQYLEALPGCNPIQDGPTPATAVAACTAISTTVGIPSAKATSL
ncbi:hypothetical protein CPB83DRAFT_859972 [Crepidotus variabilis]|uniref:DUF1996 domain-containing protein n=1 Tax=Crepidotus variabilis TaxID=179855 RepID=A0A9P6EA85_9AGAR|nr:hypothetical protein CPB83DRAFT_859972 [Crepidotus variabilis]